LTKSAARDVGFVQSLVQKRRSGLEKKLIVRDIFMSFGMRTDNARDVPFAERSALMSPSEFGGIEDRWGDRGIGR